MRYDLLNKNNVIGVFDVKKTDFGNQCIFEKTEPLLCQSDFATSMNV